MASTGHSGIEISADTHRVKGDQMTNGLSDSYFSLTSCVDI
nr:MAG TPA: hypothetical protein [Caudoviricetes sp.]